MPIAFQRLPDAGHTMGTDPDAASSDRWVRMLRYAAVGAILGGGLGHSFGVVPVGTAFSLLGFSGESGGLALYLGVVGGFVFGAGLGAAIGGLLARPPSKGIGCLAAGLGFGVYMSGAIVAKVLWQKAHLSALGGLERWVESICYPYTNAMTVLWAAGSLAALAFCALAPWIVRKWQGLAR